MSDPDRIKILARADLQRTDWKLFRAMERTFAGPEWCDWRDTMRNIASHPEGHAEPLPPEPPFGEPVSELDALKDENAELKAELERLRAEAERTFPAMDEKLSDWDAVPDEASLTTADLTEEVIQKLTAAKRKKFTELLNVELAELQQERGGPREDLTREAEIEKLLGLFARVGEM